MWPVKSKTWLTRLKWGDLGPEQNQIGSNLDEHTLVFAHTTVQNKDSELDLASLFQFYKHFIISIENNNHFNQILISYDSILIIAFKGQKFNQLAYFIIIILTFYQTFTWRFQGISNEHVCYIK